MFKKLLRKIWTIPHRRFLRRDRFERYAIGIFFIIGLSFIFLSNNRPFILFINSSIIVLTGLLAEVQQRKKFKHEEEKLFGNNYKNNLNSNRNDKFKNEIYRFFIIFWIIPIIVTVILLLIVSYIPTLNKVIHSDDATQWAALGAYIVSILTILGYIKKLFPRKQKNKSEEENTKFQTTFKDLLEKIEKHIVDIKDKGITKQFYQSIRIICEEIYEYSDRDNNIQKKYIDRLKAYINNDILIKIFTDNNILECDENDNNNLHVNIKNLIDKYSFFEYLHLSDIDNEEIGLNNPTYLLNKDAYFKKYKIFAFKGNDELMSYRIDLEEDDKAFDEYAEHHSIKVRQSVAKNKFTSIKTLKFLSEDEKAEVRQEVAFNKNTPENILEQLSNDNEKEVRVTALGNSNISQQTLKNELEKKYNKLNKDNIKEIIYIIFNNSKVYDIDKIFNQYITSVIAFMQQQSDKREYEIRQIFPYYMREIEYKHATKKIFIKSIENILDNKYHTFCYYILFFYKGLCSNKIMTYIDNVSHIIYDEQKNIETLLEEEKIIECKEKIYSIFKEHETELREFIEQLKND